MPLLHLSESQQSALVAHGAVLEAQHTPPEKPSLVEQSTVPARPVVASQQSKLFKHGSRSSLQAQTPPLQTLVPHSAAKVHGSPLRLLPQRSVRHDPTQQLLGPDGEQLCPPGWQQVQVNGLRAVPALHRATQAPPHASVPLGQTQRPA